MLFNWILVNKLAIGTPLNNQKDKSLLKEKKIISILDLRNESDLLKINYEKQLALYSEFNLFRISLPDHNSKRLATTSEIQNAVNMLEKLSREGPVFMHCHAAMERSPLISIAYLNIKSGLSLINAIDYVKQQNKSTLVNLEQLKNVNV